MTNHSRLNPFARALADHMVKERFGATYGTYDLTGYFDFVDARQAAHLAVETVSSASAQRRSIQITLDNAGDLIARIPLKDPRRHGATVWSETELGTLLDLIENGADGAWYLNYASPQDQKGYVKTAPPLGKQGTATVVTVGRLVAGAGKGRMVRFRDHNSQNLRRSNLFLVGTSPTYDDPAKRSKHDALSLVRRNSRIRESLAGANYGRPDSEGK